MAVPTLTAIEPISGHTGGETLVRITGSNFQLPPAPPATGRAPVPPPTVVVTFGGEPAVDVGVTETGELFCRTPDHDPGVVDVVLTNVDVDGVAIPGESVTLAAAYTFVRPDLTQPDELARVLGHLLLKLRQQIIDNTDWSAHTDYDDTTGDLNVAYMGKLPALVLADLEIRDVATMDASATYDVLVGTDTFIERRPPVVVDAIFSLVGISDHPHEFFNLLQAVKLFFKKNTVLKVRRNPASASDGVVEYNLIAEIGSNTRVTRQRDNSNIHSFSGQVRIEHIRLEDMPGMPTGSVPGVPGWFPHEATIRYGWTAEMISIARERIPDP